MLLPASYTQDELELEEEMRIYLMLMFAVLLALFAACAEGTAAPVPVEAEVQTPFVLLAGQTAELEAASLTIQFDEVLNDSRCPATAECITAGSVRVQVSVNGQTHTLTLGDLRDGDQTSVQVSGGLRLELLAVNPYPGSQEDTPDAAETVELVVLP